MDAQEQTPLALFLAAGEGDTFRLDELLAHIEGAAGSDPHLEQRIRLWLADCAAAVLERFEEVYPSDRSPRSAIIAARQHQRCLPDAALVTSVALSANCFSNAAANAAWAAMAALLYRPQQSQWIRIGRSAALNAAGPAGSRLRAAENVRQAQRLFAQLGSSRRHAA